jgi:hypothetical protein
MADNYSVFQLDCVLGQLGLDVWAHDDRVFLYEALVINLLVSSESAVGA